VLLEEVDNQARVICEVHSTACEWAFVADKRRFSRDNWDYSGTGARSTQHEIKELIFALQEHVLGGHVLLQLSEGALVLFAARNGALEENVRTKRRKRRWICR
jgi:hypothetical protein